MNRLRAGTLALSVLLTGCLGHSSKHNTLVGQVKRVQHMTPMWCENWDHADISLGTMRNGVGSMSTQDIWMWVPDKKQAEILEAASHDGHIVKITYDVARYRGWYACEELEEITNVEVLP